jgi:hypothetical protein
MPQLTYFNGLTGGVMKFLVLICIALSSINANASGWWRRSGCDRMIDFLSQKQDQLFVAEDNMVSAPETCKKSARSGECEDKYKKAYKRAVANFSDARDQYINNCNN